MRFIFTTHGLSRKNNTFYFSTHGLPRKLKRIYLTRGKPCGDKPCGGRPCEVGTERSSRLDLSGANTSPERRFTAVLYNEEDEPPRWKRNEDVFTHKLWRNGEVKE